MFVITPIDGRARLHNSAISPRALAPISNTAYESFSCQRSIDSGTPR